MGFLFGVKGVNDSVFFLSQAALVLDVNHVGLEDVSLYLWSKR